MIINRRLEKFQLTLLAQVIQGRISDHLVRISQEGLKVVYCSFLMSNLGSQVIHREVKVTIELLLRGQSGESAP